MSVIELTTNRLKLRLFQEEEAEHIAALCNNYAIYRSTLTMPYPYTVDDARLWMKNHRKNIEQDKRYELAVTCQKKWHALWCDYVKSELSAQAWGDGILDW